MEMFKHLNNHRESSWGLVARAESGFRSWNVTNSEDPKFSSSGLDGFLTSSNISGVQRLRLPHKNDFPISFSLAVSRSLTKIIGLEAGLSYTYLSTTFEEGAARSHCHWHYLGIPVRLTFRSFQSGRFKLYGAVGGSVEVPLSSAASLSGSSASSIVKVMPNGSFSSPCVFTLTGSYGGAFKLSEKFELFVEPTLQLRLHNDAKVPNVWSDNTVGFSLPIGLRFNW